MPKAKAPYPAGDFAIWIIIYVELVTFALLFLGYAFSRRSEVALFNESQLLLNQNLGFINTLILITSSYFVVKAVQSIKEKAKDKRLIANKRASQWLIATMLLALAFLLIKGYLLIDYIMGLKGVREDVRAKYRFIPIVWLVCVLFAIGFSFLF
jgi:nitric oxide reductase NorE protein